MKKFIQNFLFKFQTEDIEAFKNNNGLYTILMKIS